MILGINDNKSIIDLQEKFNECFPYLKLEFYSDPCTSIKSVAANPILPENVKVGDVRRLHDPGLLDIKSYYKTGRIELDFEELFGLHVQIFRRENNRWVRTSNAKNLTLQQQTELAQYATPVVRHTVQAKDESY